MQIESKKAFNTGFVLKEADLRRLIETIHEQFAKLPTTPKCSGKFGLKLRNGVMIDTTSLDEVLCLENGGSSQIVRLSYEHRTEAEGGETVARIDFINVDGDEDSGYTSMRFQVNGENRDWVFVTSSLLEERCERVRRFALNQILGKGAGAVGIRLLSPLLMSMVLLAFAFALIRSERDAPQSGKLLEAAIQSGTVKEPMDALLFLAKQNDQERIAKVYLPLEFMAALCIFLAFLFLVWPFFWRFYPVYNFCWGEYSEEFQRRESRRQFWVVIILIGLIVSFLGSVFANNLATFRNLLGQ